EFRPTQKREVFIQGLGIETQRQPILAALVDGHVWAASAIATPASAIATRICRRAHGTVFSYNGLSAQPGRVEMQLAPFDMRRRPLVLGGPAAGMVGQIERARALFFGDPHPVERLVHYAGFLAA